MIAPNLGNITFTLGGMTYEILPIGYLINGLDFNETYKGICIFGVGVLPALSGLPENMVLLGDVFLRNYYSVYDWDNKSVHLAINVHAREHVG